MTHPAPGSRNISHEPCKPGRWAGGVGHRAARRPAARRLGGRRRRERQRYAVQAPDYVAATGFLADGRYAEAIPLLRKAIAEDGPDADAYNLIGYSTRKLGRLAEALAFYEQALSIDPEHRGAHEYIGEAYLEPGRLDKAMEHLVFLDDDCWLREEYSDLKEAVARYESERR